MYLKGKIRKQLIEVKFKSGNLHFATEEMKESEKCLQSFLRLQSEDPAEEKSLTGTLRSVNARNTLCSIMFEREEFQSAEKFLLAAESSYNAFRDSFATGEALDKKLESDYTMTCLFFAQVYMYLEEPAKSAIYCERTLARKVASGDYDAREVAPLCLQLTAYYQNERRWRQALYMIAAAYTISKPVQDAQLYAEISLFMGKFFVEYMESQRNMQSYMPSMTEEVVKFPNLELDASFERDQLGGVNRGEATQENQERANNNTLNAIASAAQADEWATQACTWFTRALHHFELDGYTTEHVSICLERDHLLAMTAEFHSDRKQKKTILKRRLAHLLPLLQALSPNHFFSLVQQLLFTCAEIYEHLVDLCSIPLTDGLSNAHIITTQPAPPLPSEEKMKKVNKQVVAAVQHYQKFLDTIMTEGQLPTQLDEGVVESFFRAHLSLAKLHQRFRSSNKAVLVAMTKKSSAYYKLTDTLSRAYKPSVLQRELSLCIELSTLLAHKATALEKELM